MDARRMGRLVGDLRRFLQLFDDCFARCEGREHLQRYVRGQLSNVRRKCVEPMADAMGMAPRTLQDFLATHTWDHQRAVDRLQELVAEAHPCEEAIGLIDETSFPKRGDKTAGVQRQYCGATGKIDNCVVTVGLGYADLRGQFRCTLDHRLFLPESWSDDRSRCREANIPEELTHRPKWRIALDMLERAQANGIRFAWLTFDEGYGCNAQFLETLHRMGQSYVAEVPKSFSGWLVEPKVLQKAHHSGKGRPRRFPRLAGQGGALSHECATRRRGQELHLAIGADVADPGAASNDRRDQILRLQRVGHHISRTHLTCGLLSLAHRTMLPRREGAVGARSLRVPALSRHRTALDPDHDQPPVPGAHAAEADRRGTRGGGKNV